MRTQPCASTQVLQLKSQFAASCHDWQEEIKTTHCINEYTLKLCVLCYLFCVMLSIRSSLSSCSSCTNLGSCTESDRLVDFKFTQQSRQGLLCPFVGRGNNYLVMPCKIWDQLSIQLSAGQRGEAMCVVSIFKGDLEISEGKSGWVGVES